MTKNISEAYVMKNNYFVTLIEDNLLSLRGKNV